MKIFTGLIPNTNYNITITPYNNAGDGLPDTDLVMTMPTGKDLVCCVQFVLVCSCSGDFVILNVI